MTRLTGLLLGLLLWSAGFAQPKDQDSIKTLLQGLANEQGFHADSTRFELYNSSVLSWVHYSTDSALKYGQKAVELAREMGFVTGEGQALMSIGNVVGKAHIYTRIIEISFPDSRFLD